MSGNEERHRPAKADAVPLHSAGTGCQRGRSVDGKVKQGLQASGVEAHDRAVIEVVGVIVLRARPIKETDGGVEDTITVDNVPGV